MKCCRFLACALLVAIGIVPAAQGAGGAPIASTPPVNSAPVPAEECKIDPRRVAVDDVVLTPATDAPPVLPARGTESPSGENMAATVHEADLPTGAPVDAATLAGITATLRELAACFNAEDTGGDPGQISQQIDALFTDAFFRRTVTVEFATASAGSIFNTETVEYGKIWFGPNAPAPIVEQAWVLRDGRALAIVRPFGLRRVVFIFLYDQGMDRWLIDEEAYLADEPEGSPTP